MISDQAYRKARLVLKHLLGIMIRADENIVSVFIFRICFFRFVFDGDLIHIRGRGFRICTIRNLCVDRMRIANGVEGTTNMEVDLAALSQSLPDADKRKMIDCYKKLDFYAKGWRD